MARLGDVCTIVSGTTPSSTVPEYWDGDINWITPAEMSDESGVIYESKRKITELAVKKSGLSPFPAGTVLLSSRAPIGKVGIAGVEMYCNQGFKNLICSDAIYNKYLYWFLIYRKEHLNSLGRGATFKEISKSIVETIDIPLPSISEQKKVASLLDTVSELISLRKKQLQKLDDLVKSRFVEMFGDMTMNPNGWEKTGLGIVCDVRDGTHDSPEYFDEGYPLVTSKNVTGGKVNFTDCSFISEADYLKINERSKVDYGDILMPMIGTVGKPVIVDVVTAFAIKNVALLKFTKDSKVINSFVQALLQSDYFDRSVLSRIRGGTQKFIALGDIRNLQVCVPPMKLQLAFQEYANQTNKIKLTVQHGLDKLELLKQSLMQKYFG